MTEHCRYVLLLGFVGLAACGHGSPNATGDGGDDGQPVDSRMSTPCWLDTYTPGGAVQLGTGATTFIAMPDNIELEYGTQNGFDIPVNAQMTGLMPGTPNDPLDPNNPRTRFHGYFVDTGVLANPGRCGVRLGYAPSTGGWYSMVHGSSVVFDPALTGKDLFGRQVRVVLEVIDGAGNYATTEKIVTCQPPPGWTM